MPAPNAADLPAYEYRVVPAPRRGIKVKTARTTEDRFAAALEASLNAQGAEGWEFVRSDTLPSEERQGLTGRTTVYHTVLIYRRPIAPAAGSDLAPRRMITAPVIAPPAPVAAPAPLATSAPVAAPADDAAPAPLATRPVGGVFGRETAQDAEMAATPQSVLPPVPPPVLPGVHAPEAAQAVPPLGAAGPRPTLP